MISQNIKYIILIIVIFLAGCLFTLSLVSWKQSLSIESEPATSYIPKEGDIDGVSAYAYTLPEDPSVGVYGWFNTRDRVAITDHGKTLATFSVPYEQGIKIVRVLDDQIDVLSYMSSPFRSIRVYIISRKDGAIQSVESQGSYLTVSPDHSYLVFESAEGSENEKTTFIHFKSFLMDHDDYSITLPMKPGSGTYRIDDIEYSPDGTKMAIIVMDQKQDEAKPNKWHGILFSLDLASKTATQVQTLEREKEEGPIDPFMEIISGWDSPSIVHLKLSDGQEMSVDLAK